MKVGIITLPFGPNYGWALQSWALYHAVEKLGHSPIVINRRWSSGASSLKIKVKRWLYYSVICPRIKRFSDKEISNRTVMCRDSASTTEATIAMDAVIAGSDQIWRMENTRLAGFDFFLDFVKNDNIRRISYAASFGRDEWSGTVEEANVVRNLLHKFNYVSVREDTGVEICNNLFGVNAEHVLDPTLLFTAKEYNRLLPTEKKEKTFVTYILDSTIEKRELVNKIANVEGLKVINLYPKKTPTYYKSVYYWLKKIRDARYVVVDSFHGMVFCIIFHKQFAVLANKKRGLTRFTSLLSQLGLSNKMTTDFSKENVMKVLNARIDYNDVDEKLNYLRVKSFDFLKSALS